MASLSEHRVEPVCHVLSVGRSEQGVGQWLVAVTRDVEPGSADWFVLVVLHVSTGAEPFNLPVVGGHGRAPQVFN